MRIFRLVAAILIATVITTVPTRVVLSAQTGGTDPVMEPDGGAAATSELYEFNARLRRDRSVLTDPGRNPSVLTDHDGAYVVAAKAFGKGMSRALLKLSGGSVDLRDHL